MKSTENLSKITVKSSMYSFAGLLILKLGGLIFTAAVARLLFPELFGIYSLVLSIIIIVMVFTDLGTNNTFLRYFSEALGKEDKEEARSYLRYLLKIKFVFILFAILILLLTSKFLANFFEKPEIFLPLILSSFFILIEPLRNFFITIFVSIKDLKPVPVIDIIFQSSKIIFSIILIIVLPTFLKISGIFVAFSLSALVSLILVFLILIKKDKSLFFGKTKKINKSRILKYLRFVSIASVSLVFFGSIDILMLGKFVSAGFLGYYRASLSLVLTISVLIPFSGILLPIFTQINKERLSRGLEKTFRYIMILSIPIVVGLIFLAKYVIFTIYGNEYLLSVNSLYVLSILIITFPLINLYSTLFQAKEKVKILALFTFIALITNIFLNYFLITFMIDFGEIYAVMGVSIATILSRILLLSGLIFITKKQYKIKYDFKLLSKILFSTGVMTLFLVVFNYYIDINIITGILEILIGAGIYFFSMFLTKGINKEDVKLLRYLIKK